MTKENDEIKTFKIIVLAISFILLSGLLVITSQAAVNENNELPFDSHALENNLGIQKWTDSNGVICYIYTGTDQDISCVYIPK